MEGALGVPPDGFTHAALARIGPDGTEEAWSWGGAPVGARMRMASISKLATARAVVAAGIDPAAPVSQWLNHPALRHVRVGDLLSHTSGLTDHAGYIADPPASPLEFLDAPLAVAGTVPGAFFRYANLNYMLAGLILERATGQRFDALLRRLVLDPAGIAGGFNWVGAPRDAVLPVAQWTGGALVVQADGPGTDWSADLIWRDGVGASLEDYRIGADTALFSPHAGLRVSVAEAARLVRFALSGPAGEVMLRPRWRHDGTNGMDCDGLFTAFGLGVTLYDDHPRIPGHLAGHAGHALGFTGGVWRDMARGTCWAYALNGSPDLTEDSGDEAFYAGPEARIMESLAVELARQIGSCLT